jgi:hypothetical protein
MRDEMAAGHGMNWAGAYTGVWNPKTGEATAGFSGRNGCAEACGKDFLGLEDRAARFTRAYGWFAKPKGTPKRWQERPICAKCQERYSPRQFPRRVKYERGGRWDTNIWTRIIYLLRFIGFL